MRTLPLLLTLSFVGLAIGGGVGYWQMKAPSTDLEKPIVRADVYADQRNVELFLKDFHPNEAADLLSHYRDEFTETTSTGRKWIELAVQTAIELRDKEELLDLYTEFPGAFQSNEQASLLLAEYFLQHKDLIKYDRIRSGWFGENVTFPERWVVLDSNLLEIQGRRSAAIELLGSQSYQGTRDTNRLVRLAMLSLPESPANAWDYLSEALRKDPKNSDLRMYRAKLLESENRPTLALSEYVAAVNGDPKNPFMRDQLVEFYVRRQQYPEALQIMVEGLKYPTIDSAWIKAAFWNKVAGPSDILQDKNQIPLGKTKPFISYILGLYDDQFWNAKAFAKLANYQHYLETQPVTVWLRTFDLLKDGRENDAAELLALNPFQNTFLNPELEVGIRRILNYRLNGTLVLNDTPNDYLSDNNAKGNVITFDSLPFLDQLSILSIQQAADPDFTLPLEIQNLLKSPLAFVAALLSQNWNQAAIALNSQNVFPEGIPSWVAVKMTRAIQRNQGLPEALKFAKKQLPNPDLQLVVAELLLSNKSPAEAIALLDILKTYPGDVGSRASLLLSLIYADQKNYQRAKEAILTNELLSEEVAGIEALARIALLEGYTKEAERLYDSIQSDSAEARSYLARKAFSDKNWVKARQLTISLIQEFPNNQLLRDNLYKINNEISLNTMLDGNG